MFVALDFRSSTLLWRVRQNWIPFLAPTLAIGRLPASLKFGMKAQGKKRHRINLLWIACGAAEVFRGTLLLRHLISDAGPRSFGNRSSNRQAENQMNRDANLNTVVQGLSQPLGHNDP
jgi:hypothetical protein